MTRSKDVQRHVSVSIYGYVHALSSTNPSGFNRTAAIIIVILECVQYVYTSIHVPVAGKFAYETYLNVADPFLVARGTGRVKRDIYVSVGRILSFINDWLKTDRLSHVQSPRG